MLTNQVLTENKAKGNVYFNILTCLHHLFTGTMCLGSLNIMKCGEKINEAMSYYLYPKYFYEISDM